MEHVAAAAVVVVKTQRILVLILPVLVIICHTEVGHRDHRQDTEAQVSKKTKTDDWLGGFRFVDLMAAILVVILYEVFMHIYSF